MQSAFSIPPLTEDGVKRLIGLRVKVGRRTNPSKFWWVVIHDVKYINPHSAVALVGGSYTGKDWWVRLADCRFAKHVDEPLLVAIHRANYGPANDAP